MRTNKLLPLLAITLLMVTSCTKNEKFDLPKFSQPLGELKATYIGMEAVEAIWPSDGCGLQMYDLYGGQTIHMGTVSVITSGEMLYVKYMVSGEYLLTEAHVFIGDASGLNTEDPTDDMPMGKSNNPKIGHFPYAWEGAGSRTVVLEIELADELECFDIAAHAVVRCADNTCEETAWAKSTFVGSVLVLKSRMDLVGGGAGPTMLAREDNTEGIIFDVKDMVGETFDLVKHDDIDVVAGLLTVVEVSDMIEFRITSNTNFVYWTHLFLGSLVDLNIIGPWNHWSFPFQQSTPNGVLEHVFAFPASILDETFEGIEFGGARWGWYIPQYCIVDCPPPTVED